MLLAKINCHKTSHMEHATTQPSPPLPSPPLPSPPLPCIPNLLFRLKWWNIGLIMRLYYTMVWVWMWTEYASCGGAGWPCKLWWWISVSAFSNWGSHLVSSVQLYSQPEEFEVKMPWKFRVMDLALLPIHS